MEDIDYVNFFIKVQETFWDLCDVFRENGDEYLELNRSEFEYSIASEYSGIEREIIYKYSSLLKVKRNIDPEEYFYINFKEMGLI
jgi:hypothetical protein